MYTLKFAPEKILLDSMYKGCLEIRSILAQYIKSRDSGTTFAATHATAQLVSS